jgi:hypothetical protein
MVRPANSNHFKASGQAEMIDPVWRFIDMVAAHPFASVVIAFAIFFVASVYALITVTYARTIWRMPMIRLPPPEDRVHPETQNGNNVVIGFVLFVIAASALIAIWHWSGQLR